MCVCIKEGFLDSEIIEIPSDGRFNNSPTGVGRVVAGRGRLKRSVKTSYFPYLHHSIDAESGGPSVKCKLMINHKSYGDDYNTHGVEKKQRKERAHSRR